VIITEYITKRKIEIRDDMWDTFMTTFGVVAVPNGTSEIDMLVASGIVKSRREARELKNNLEIECVELDVFFVARTKKGHLVDGRFVVIEQDYELDES
jgi:hypothetical protein